ncbi:site-specific integrase [Phyllobacterium sp. UNC302MFCol5.2]|uniref:tyrosine-type recombinase/integrase n=1 Tax=Phyllobacterium sp. UNC302MFCol5.2 TaxID=1449065 RepID=UPI00068CE21B|nr:site-specific integrase [Phyllobacterium sp. UNC302MFCol5.2]
MTAKKVKLIKSTVDALKPAVKPFRVFDAELKGFCVRVAPTGDKRWQVEYRPAPGGRGIPVKRLTLGPTAVLTADEARSAAKATLAEVAKGTDPVADKISKRRELKVTDLIDLYEREGTVVQRGVNIGKPLAPRNKAYTLAALRHHVVPLLGNKRVSEVMANDIERMVRDIAAGKTAKDGKFGPRQRIIVRGGEGAARRVVRVLSAVYTFALRRTPPLASQNPCEKAKVNKVDGRRTRFLNLGEVRQLGRALDELETEGVNPKALAITRLWALTGCRRDEIAGLLWSEVDFDFACLRLAASKTGKSVRPLATPAMALLAALPRYGGSPYVFPATRGDGHFQGTKRIWPTIVKRAGLPGVTPHTLRHTLGSASVSSGETLAMTGAILGHSDHQSTAIYAHLQTSPVQQAANRVVVGIAAALAGKPARSQQTTKKRVS